MNWKASPPKLEIAASWTAAAFLGGATGFAIVQLAPFGAGLVAAGGAGTLVALFGFVLIGRVDRRRGSSSLAAVATLDNFFITDTDGPGVAPADEDVLLLDEPLLVVGDETRVIRLFDGHPVGSMTAATPIAGPGEMVARIEDFLGHARSGAEVADDAPQNRRLQPEDASAALHAALADIRRSLRQG